MSVPHEPAEVVQSRLGALASVASAVSGAHELDEVLEIAADQILTALDVSSVSISRWHLEEGVLQTLINVGELGPGEERLPAYETYEIALFPLAYAMLSRGEPHVTSLADDNADEAERELLRELGKVACAAVPIVYEGATWGEIYVTSGAETPPLRPSDLAFLQEICAQLAQAIGRAERFSALLDAAYRDALTGIANRRAFDEHLAGSLDPDSDAGVTLLLGDVDGLKGLNDGSGHAAGDAALRLVGTVLTKVCGPQARPARIGGDEFAVILDSGSVAAADALVAEITAALASVGAAVAVSWGAAHSDPPHRGVAELTRAADLAQYATKRRRVPRAGAPVAADRRAARVPSPVLAGHSVLATLAAGLELLDGLAAAPALERCVALADLVAGASRATHWWITGTGGRILARGAAPGPPADAAAGDLVATGPTLRLHWARPAPGWAEEAAACVTLLAREAQRSAPAR